MNAHSGLHCPQYRLEIENCGWVLIRSPFWRDASRAYRRAEGGDADYDGTAELLSTFADVGGSAVVWADKVVNNRKPAHTKKHAPLKAEVFRQAAEKLNGLGYTRRDHLRRAYGEDKELKALKDAWIHLPSLRSGVTYNYPLILAGFQ